MSITRGHGKTKTKLVGHGVTSQARVPSSLSHLDDEETTWGPVTIESFVKSEMTRTEGSPEWRDWLTRQAARLGLA